MFYLDEIGYASKALQQRLLQICQSDKFHPLGSEQFETSDKRIIFATNLDLKTGGRPERISTGPVLAHAQLCHPDSPAGQSAGTKLSS